jgi:3-hydroxymyristoyl/3-hydroxydecanoyl-(acyl carrier protein) dehydratase
VRRAVSHASGLSFIVSFLFVHRITELDSQHARGELCCASDAADLPVWVAIEAIGQLACWIAAARSDFTTRPVAAVVREGRIPRGMGTAAAARVVLEAQLERVDRRAVLYGGRALADGLEIAGLGGCVGPTLPLDSFDDPAAVRARFAALRAGSTGLPPLSPADLPAPDLRDLTIRGTTGRADLWVPTAAPFFADHFPRQPVYPASLLAAAQNELAKRVAASVFDVPPEDVAPTLIADFKVRAFSPPGQRLVLSAEAQPPQGERVSVALTAVQGDGQRIASSMMEYRLQRAPR